MSTISRIIILEASTTDLEEDAAVFDRVEKVILVTSAVCACLTLFTLYLR